MTKKDIFGTMGKMLIYTTYLYQIVEIILKYEYSTVLIQKIGLILKTSIQTYRQDFGVNYVIGNVL